MKKIDDLKTSYKNVINAKAEELDTYKRIESDYYRILNKLKPFIEYSNPDFRLVINDPRCYNNKITIYFWAYCPYNMEIKKELDSILSKLGFKFDIETDSEDKATLDNNWMINVDKFVENNIFPYYVSVDIEYSALRENSTCVLVPLETELVTKVKTYDRICPEGHPEMFDENGEFIPSMHPLIKK